MGQATYYSGTDRYIGQGSYNLYFNPTGDSLYATVTNVAYKFRIDYNNGSKVDLGKVDIYLYSPNGERHTIYYNFDHFGNDTDAGKDSDGAYDYDIYYDGTGGESTFSSGFDGNQVNGNWRLRIDNDTGRTLTMHYFEAKVDFLTAPDMIVEDIEITGDRALGEKVKIEATLKNIGETDYFGIGRNFDVEYLVNGRVVGTDSVTYGLNAGQSNKESFTYTVTTAGQQNVEVRVTGISGEGVTSNNSRSTGFFAEAPDLVVQDIQVFGEIKTGEEIRLKATLANIGGADYGGLLEGGFELEYYVETTSGTDRYIGKDSVSFGLTAGQTNTETIRYTLQSGDTGTFKVRIVDTTNESDITNNTRTELVGEVHDERKTVANSLEDVELGTLFARSVYGEEKIGSGYRGSDDNGLGDRYDNYFDTLGWQVLTDSELGDHFVPNDDARFNGGGLFEGRTDALVPSWDAQSLLAVGETADGTKTLILTFRGTDDSFAAFANGQAFSGDGLFHHYNAHKPLVEAAISYANDPSNGIEKLIVSGHSLGGSMADIFASVDAQRLAEEVELTVVSLASAGIDKTLYSHTEAFDGFENQHDPNVVDVDGGSVDLTEPSYYIGLSHNKDAVTFAETVDLDSIDGYVGNNILRNNKNFDDAITSLFLPNLDNSETDSGGFWFPKGFGAHHNVGVYWANISALASDTLAQYYDNSQKISFGLTDYSQVKDIDGGALPVFATYTGGGTPGYDNDSGLDTLRGGATADYILGLTGDDTIVGGLGDDLLSGGAGLDTIAGGEGNDILSGGADADTLAGNSGNDKVFGDAGRDQLQGGTGRDKLVGGGGNDRLTGDNGSDKLIGGNGRDTMTGGTGNDIFIFRTVKEIRSDRIRDFTTGDRVDLSGLDASQAEAGNQAFDFVGDTAFSGTAGELRYEALSDKLMLQGDVDGDGLADFSIIMTGLTSLQTSDLIL
jgi:Ca2+-binding RTX toxin-like protein